MDRSMNRVYARCDTMNAMNGSADVMHSVSFAVFLSSPFSFTLLPLLALSLSLSMQCNRNSSASQSSPIASPRPCPDSVQRTRGGEN